MRLHSNQNDHGDQDCEQRALQHTFTLGRSTVLATRVLSKASRLRAGSRASSGASLGVAANAALDTRDGVVTDGRGSSSRRVVSRHVGTRGKERLEDCRFVGDLDGVVGGRVVCVDVRLVALDVGAGWRVIALHGDISKRGVVVTVLLDVFTIPVNKTTGPLDRALAVARETSGPNRELNPGRRLGEFETVRGLIPRL